METMDYETMELVQPSRKF